MAWLSSSSSKSHAMEGKASQSDDATVLNMASNSKESALEAGFSSTSVQERRLFFETCWSSASVAGPESLAEHEFRLVAVHMVVFIGMLMS
jgi:hypothetical protein